MFDQKRIAQYLGMQPPWEKYKKLLFLGLDNSGKTTLLHMYQCDQCDSTVQQHFVPTRFPSSNEMSTREMNFTVFDLGGHAHYQLLWKDYFAIVDAAVFLIDVHDVKRLPHGKAALNAILADKELEQCPILILGNKMDLPGAIPEHILRSYLELHNATGKEYAPRPRSELSSRPLELFMCSVLNRQGCDQGFRWLAEYLR